MPPRGHAGRVDVLSPAARLEPWMLRLDWRGDSRECVAVDLATWPEDQPLDPLPPVPVIGTGPHDHPVAAQVDALASPEIGLGALVLCIEAAPAAAQVVVDLLRCTEGLPPAQALVAESLAYAALQGSAAHREWRAADGEPAAPGAVRIDRRDSGLHLTLDRPEAHNAIDRAMRDALHDAFVLARLDPEIRVVRLGATGRCFSTGADLAEFGTTTDPAAAHAIRMKTLPARALLEWGGRFEVHVQGPCIGSGLELAAFADRLTASPDAWFQLPELRMGILPGAGGCVSLPRRIGRQRTAALILSGRRIGARTALEWGLVDAIVDDAPGNEGEPD